MWKTCREALHSFLRHDTSSSNELQFQVANRDENHKTKNESQLISDITAAITDLCRDDSDVPSGGHPEHGY
jgi:hypothetical protein